MKYRVVWRESSQVFLDQSVFIAMEMAGGESVLAAYKTVNAQLAHRSDEVGESREGSERVLIVGPLAAFYEVFEASATVMIYRVHYRGYPKIDV